MDIFPLKEKTENSLLFYSMYALWFQLWYEWQKHLITRNQRLCFVVSHYDKQLCYKSEVNKGVLDSLQSLQVSSDLRQ